MHPDDALARGRSTVRNDRSPVNRYEGTAARIVTAAARPMARARHAVGGRGRDRAARRRGRAGRRRGVPRPPSRARAAATAGRSRSSSAQPARNTREADDVVDAGRRGEDERRRDGEHRHEQPRPSSARRCGPHEPVEHDEREHAEDERHGVRHQCPPTAAAAP